MLSTMRCMYVENGKGTNERTITTEKYLLYLAQLNKHIYAGTISHFLNDNVLLLHFSILLIFQEYFVLAFLFHP